MVVFYIREGKGKSAGKVKEWQVRSPVHSVSPAVEPVLIENDIFFVPHLLRRCSCLPNLGLPPVQNSNKHRPEQFL